MRVPPPHPGPRCRRWGGGGAHKDEGHARNRFLVLRDCCRGFTAHPGVSRGAEHLSWCILCHCVSWLRVVRHHGCFLFCGGEGVAGKRHLRHDLQGCVRVPGDLFLLRRNDAVLLGGAHHNEGHVVAAGCCAHGARMAMHTRAVCDVTQIARTLEESAAVCPGAYHYTRHNQCCGS